MAYLNIKAARWREQPPTFNCILDQNHPLVRGMVWFTDGAHAINYVDGFPLNGTGSASPSIGYVSTWGPFGPGVVVPRAAQDSYWRQPKAVVTTMPLTMAAHSYYNGAGLTTCVLSIANQVTDNTHRLTYSGAGTPSIQSYDGVTAGTASVSVGANSNTYGYVAGVVRSASDRQAWYKQINVSRYTTGTNATSTTPSISTTAANTSLGAYIGGSGTLYAWLGWVGPTAIWNWDITEAGILEFYEYPYQVLLKPVNRTYFLPTGGGSSVPLTGLSATTTGGTLVPNTSIALTGQSATVSGGTLTPTVGNTAALTGQAATVSGGTLVPSLSIALTGQSMTASGGTLTPTTGTTVALSGLSATVSRGTLSPATSISMSGLQAILSGGTLTPSVPGQFNPSIFAYSSPSDGQKLECAVCGFYPTKASPLRKRWDGLWVCKHDFEVRHPGDLYNPKFRAPIIKDGFRQTDQNYWTPTIAGITGAGSGTTTVIAEYQNTGTEIRYTITIKNSTSTTTTSAASATFSVPVAASSDIGGTATKATGVYLGQVTVSGGSIRPPNWTATSDTIVIRGRYNL